MLTRNKYLLCTFLVCFGASTAWAQTSISEFQKVLAEKASFQETDFAALQANQPVVRLAPVSDKREVAVAGLVNIRAGADEFLRSYRDSMLRKSNTAILEIGSFSSQPVIADLESLTLETRDIEDLKDCVAGDCQVKLSAAMIERFRKEIDWNAPDYALKVTNLFKQMLSEYVSDYRARGEAALIRYHDKRNEIDLASEQRALSKASGYINDLLADSKAGLQLIDEAIVWSKIKFGLKPVIAVNHITIYKRDREVGPQVLIASKQIYASHYFNASIALTAFVTVPAANQGAFLVSENRSRADGLEGPLGKIKRGVVEKKALEGLKTILERSQASLDGSAVGTTAEFSSHQAYGWGQRLFGGVRPLLWLLVLSALIALLLLGKRRVDSATAPKGKTLKPESAKS
ncbi:MAG TPA: hypothetical protein VF290_06370 [Pyrinomonadaceae bacterium]